MAQEPNLIRGDDSQAFHDVVYVVGNHRTECVHRRFQNIAVDGTHFYRLTVFDEHVFVQVLVIFVRLHRFQAGKPPVHRRIAAERR